MKNKEKDKNNQKKILIIIAICILFILILCSIFWFLENRKWTIPKKSEIMQFLNYDEPFDGVAEIANYEKVTIKMDDVFDNVWNNFVDSINSTVIDYGKEIKGQIIKEDSIVHMEFTYSCEDKSFTRDIGLNLGKVDMFGVNFMDTIRKDLVGKTDGYENSFTMKVSECEDLDIYFDANSIIEFSYVVIDCYDGFEYEVLDDEFVRESFYEVASTVEELERYVKSQVAMELSYDEDLYYEIIGDFLEKYLQDNSTIIKQATPIQKESLNNANEALRLAAYFAYGVSEDVYLENVYHMTKEEYLEYYQNNFSNRDTLLVLIAYNEGLSSLEELYEKYLQDAATLREEDFETMINSDFYVENSEKQEFIREILYKKLIDEHCEIIESNEYPLTYAFKYLDDEDYLNEVLNGEISLEEYENYINGNN